MTPDDLSGRLWQFAARVGKVVDALPDTRLGRHVAGQLVRSGTAAALKEQRETCGWLGFIIIARLLSAKRVAPLLDEGKQLTKIIGRSIVTAKSKRRNDSAPTI